MKVSEQLKSVNIGPANSDGMSDFSIVRAYFLGGKKLFKDLDHLE